MSTYFGSMTSSSSALASTNIGGYIMVGLGDGAAAQSTGLNTTWIQNSTIISTAWTTYLDPGTPSSDLPHSNKPSYIWDAPPANTTSVWKSSSALIQGWIYQTTVEFPNARLDPENVNDDLLSCFESINPVYSSSSNVPMTNDVAHLTNSQTQTEKRQEPIHILSILIQDTTKRVFQPQQRGYLLISNLVFYDMGATNALLLNEPVPVEIPLILEKTSHSLRQLVFS